MAKFGPESLRKLRTCDERLQRVLNAVIVDFDMQVLEGHRGEAAQNEAFRTGHSKLKWPNGNHNAYPSKAVDVAPFPVDFKNRERFFYMAGLIMATAKSMGIKLRWGGDWGQDGLDPQKFDDLPHLEVIG